MPHKQHIDILEIVSFRKPRSELKILNKNIPVFSIWLSPERKNS